MKQTDWHSGPTFGGEPLTSRYVAKRLAASDLCVGIIRDCPTCHEKYYATPQQPVHGCDPRQSQPVRVLG